MAQTLARETQIDSFLAQLAAAWRDFPSHVRDAVQAVVRPYLPSEGSDFTRDFTAAFDRLDRASGNRNWLSIVDLRRELATYDRQTFDAGLAELRKSEKFTLSATEGRHGIGPEERAAGIRESGALLLWVSRRRGEDRMEASGRPE